MEEGKHTFSKPTHWQQGIFFFKGMNQQGQRK
jgi:hypothetical protein